MKLFKIVMDALWLALLMNCVTNFWAENYVLATCEAACLCWMAAVLVQAMAIEDLRRVAERENRWGINWHEARRWFAEFPDAADALDYVRNEVDGTRPFDIQRLRDNMRARRDEAA